MNYFFPLLCTIVLSFSAFSQHTFQKGYFISNSGKKTECLIKNLDWRANPTEFKWKENESADEKIATIKNVSEFSIGENIQYNRYTLSFDMTSTRAADLKIGRKLDLEERTVFLKTLLASSSCKLFEYHKGNATKFFYTSPSKNAPQLLKYKKYLASDNVSILENNDYLYQLQKEINCAGVPLKSIKYTKKSLLEFFNKYLECKGEKSDYKPVQKKVKTKFGVIAGIDLVGFTHYYDKSNFGIFTSTEQYMYDNTSGMRFGVYSESVLPFHNSKISLFGEGSYTSFKTNLIETNFTDLEATRAGKVLNYKSLDFTIGIRYYFFLNKSAVKKTKLFLESGLTYAIESKTTLEPLISSENNGPNALIMPYGIGMGVSYDRYKIIYRYQIKRDPLKFYTSRSSELSINTLLVTVAIF